MLRKRDAKHYMGSMSDALARGPKESTQKQKVSNTKGANNDDRF